MKKKTAILFLIVIVIGGLFLTGCNTDPQQETVAQEEKEKVEENMEEMQRQIGQPNIDDFFEKKQYKRIMELRDNSELVCHAYTKNRQGKLIYQGKVIGYGLPYSIQYTSPKKIVDENDIESGFEYGQGYGDAIMPQAEPNGLYMPEGLSATWLIMIDEETGETKPAYYEPSIIVRQEKAPRRLCAEWSLPEDY